MKIAQIAPIIESVPPKKYGGTERVVWELTEGLVKRGHDVTLFASGDSQTSARLSSIYPKSLREIKQKDIYGPNILSLLNIGFAYSKQNKFDIIHDHTGHLGLPTANISQTPVVMTYHGTFNAENRRIFQCLDKPFIVSISKAQVRSVLGLNYAGNVYNGLDMSHYQFSQKGQNYLLMVGRLSIEKGVHLAIDVAQYLNLPLIIAAKLDSYDLTYFNEYIGPRLSDQIRWVGEVDQVSRNKLMKNALCLLHPITWPEPFGLVMIEAMACGCPVIAINKGSVSEIIQNKRTGFVVEDVNEMIDAVAKIRTINRAYCRKYVLEKFNSKRMTQEYEKIYQTILDLQLKGPQNTSLAKLTKIN